MPLFFNIRPSGFKCNPGCVLPADAGTPEAGGLLTADRFAPCFRVRIRCITPAWTSPEAEFENNMFRIDMHVHTVLGGDSRIRPEEVADRARAAGLDAVCITEHHSWDLSRPFDEISRKTGFPIFRGLEYRAAEGHLLIYGVCAGRADLPPGLPMQNAIDWVCARGGAAVPAHPFQRGMVGKALGSAVLDLEHIVAIETLNASLGDEENRLAADAARKMGLSGIGGSDAHGPQVLGKAFTVFAGPILSMDGLVRALKAGGYRPAKWTSQDFSESRHGENGDFSPSRLWKKKA